MARLTEIYYIKYPDEAVDNHGVPKLYRPDGAERTDHEFPVTGGNGTVFVFTIPSVGPERTLRFNNAGDPEGTPRKPVTWTHSAETPAWITLYDPIDPPYKTLSMMVDNTNGPVERQASFNLNLYDSADRAPYILCIRKEGGAMQLDPTIVEKAPISSPEPPPGPPQG